MGVNKSCKIVITLAQKCHKIFTLVIYGRNKNEASFEIPAVNFIKLSQRNLHRYRRIALSFDTGYAARRVNYP